MWSKRREDYLDDREFSSQEQDRLLFFRTLSLASLFLAAAHAQSSQRTSCETEAEKRRSTCRVTALVFTLDPGGRQ